MVNWICFTKNHQSKPSERNQIKLRDVFYNFLNFPLPVVSIGLLFITYSFILLGNDTIVLITRVVFSFGKFSFLEIWYIYITLPRMVLGLKKELCLSLPVLQNCASLLPWEPQRDFSWLWCTMTFMWLSVTLCSILYS